MKRVSIISSNFGQLYHAILCLLLLLAARTNAQRILLEGEMKYLESKHILVTANYKHDTLHGYYRKYDLEIRQPVMEGTYNMVFFTGFVWNYIGKRLTWETPYVKNKRHGVQRSYNSRRQVDFTLTYVNDQLHGISEFFYPNGDLEQVAYYRYGVRSDTILIYPRNTKKTLKIIWEHDTPRYYYLFDRDSNLICFNDVFHGKSDEWMNYQKEILAKKRIFLKSYASLGWKYIHKDSGEVFCVYYKSPCSVKRKGKKKRG